MKLCVVHVSAEDVSGPYTALIEKNFDRAKRPETVLVHKYVRKLRRATDTVLAYPILLNKVDVVDRLIEAQREGVDGAFVACSGDPGILEGSSILPVPVVGCMEATMHLACTYARKFGVVTVADEGWVEFCDQIVFDHGLSSRYAGVGALGIATSEIFSFGFAEPERACEHIIEAARQLIAKGAQAIVIGSAGLSVMAGAAGLSCVPGTGVPVFDCLTVGLKTTELRVDLAQKLGVPETSRTGLRAHLSDKDLGRLGKLFERPWSATQ